MNGTTTKYVYDGADLIAETNTAGTVTARYLFGPSMDEPLELKRGTTTSYYSADGLGSIAHLTNASGTIAESSTDDPDGLPTLKNGSGTVIPTSALGNPFLFTGREWDSETGLYGYRARDYKPSIGRFLSRDPLGYAPDANLYRYVGNNPLTFVDPFGSFSLPVGGGGWTCLDCGGWQGPKLGGGPIIDTWPTPSPGPLIDTWPGAPPFPPGDRGPTKSQGSLGGMGQPGVEKANGTRTPGKGKPNSEQEFPNEKGGKTKRRYGPDGRAKQDIDHGHDHGAGDPHVHDWDWGRPRGQERGPGRAPRPGEL